MITVLIIYILGAIGWWKLVHYYRESPKYVSIFEPLLWPLLVLLLMLLIFAAILVGIAQIFTNDRNMW